MKLSIIIPVYNEEKTIAKVLKQLSKLTVDDVSFEIIVVNDASSDKTEEKIHSMLSVMNNIHYVIHSENKGKGKAIITGLKYAKGNYILIQDADLEYHPSNIPNLLQPIISGKSQVVYGTRLKRLPNFSRDERTVRFFIHYVGNRMLSLIMSVLYSQWITDIETCYKLFPKNSLKGVTLKAKGFEFEPEITAILLKKKYKIHEVPISTNPRGYKEGKKLNTVKDGIKAVKMIISSRIR